VRVLSAIKEKISGSRDTLYFARNVGAGASAKVKYKLPADATVERITARFYPGQERDLHVKVYAINPETEQKIDLITYPDNQKYLSGDNDDPEFTPSRNVPKDAVLVVEYDNTSGQYAYDYVANIEIDYAGGLDRVIS